MEEKGPESNLPATMIIAAAGGEEPSRKQIRDLEKLKMGT